MSHSSNSKKQTKRKKSKSPSVTNHSTKKNTVSHFCCNAKDVMQIKFIRSETDFDTNEGFFKPKYVHQLFSTNSKETIYGYRQLSIRVYFSQPHMYALIEIAYAEKMQNSKECTDIIACFERKMSAGFTQNRQAFIEKLNEEFSPPGQLHCEILRKDLNKDPNDSEDIASSSDEDEDDDSKSMSESESQSQSDSESEQDENESKNDNTRMNSIADEIRNRKRRLSDMSGGSNSNNNSNGSKTANAPTKKRRRSLRLSNKQKQNQVSPPQRESPKANAKHRADEQGRPQPEWTWDINDSPFADEDIVYELRIGQLSREPMKSFHQRMQIFVLLYIESSNYLEQDEVWDVLVLSKRIRISSEEDGDEDEEDSSNDASCFRYETLGYITLYKYFAWPDQQRLRISQVIIFPPFQRRRHGFEMVQHVHKMSVYQNFIEVNIEDPNYNCQFLRDLVDCYNCYQQRIFTQSSFNISNLTTFHDSNAKKKEIKCFNYQSMYSAVTVNNHNTNPSANLNSIDIIGNINSLKKTKEPLFAYKNGFVSIYNKLPTDIYHEEIMSASKLLRITPNQSRYAYECLKLETIDLENEEEYQKYRLDVKRRLLKYLHDTEGIQAFDEHAMRAVLRSEYTDLEQRYFHILTKRDQLLDELPKWQKNHFYPPFVQQQLDAAKHNNKKMKRKTRRSKRKPRQR